MSESSSSASLPDHTNPQLVGRNRLPPRSRFTSYPSVEAALAGINDGTPSPWEMSLNGTWQFRLFPRPVAVPDNWRSESAEGEWDDMEVPSHWQLAVAGDTLTPTGVYRLRFSVPSDWREMRKIIRFDGVDGCMTLACNGREVGLNKGSRLMAEFDLTGFLKDGENVIAVKVIQYGDHSYVEDQDVWWLSGIFRDVTLLAEPKGGTHDARVNATFGPSPTGSGSNVCKLSVTLDTNLYGYRLLDAAGTTVDDTSDVLFGDHSASGEFFRWGIQAEPWNAETPTIYTLVLQARGDQGVEQFIPVRVGFRTVDIAKSVLRLNGQPVKLRGVNRHEWSQTRGRSVAKQDMLDDVLLMKRHNVNCVRTSHHPPHPHFLDLCDRHGLLVILECDLESHGMAHLYPPSAPADEPPWRAAHVDRIERTVARDRNHASVIVWSLGNAAGVGDNFPAMATVVREMDPTRPVHCEGGWRGEIGDFISQDELAAGGRHGGERPTPRAP